MDRTESLARRYCAWEGVDFERLDAETASIVYTRPVDGMKSHGWYLWEQVEREACDWCRGIGETGEWMTYGEGPERTREIAYGTCERCEGDGFIHSLETARGCAHRETGPGGATDFTRPLK